MNEVMINDKGESHSKMRNVSHAGQEVREGFEFRVKLTRGEGKKRRRIS